MSSQPAAACEYCPVHNAENLIKRGIAKKVEVEP